MAIVLRRLMNKEYILEAHNLRKRCVNKGFGRDSRSLPKTLESQLIIDRTEEVSFLMDKDPQEDSTL